MKEDFHRLAVAEVQRQLSGYVAKRQEISSELAALNAARYAKGNKASPLPVFTELETKARQRAREMLNGSTPQWLQEAPQSPGREEGLRVELASLDIVIRALGEKRTAAEAAAAAEWAQKNGEPWRKLCREILVTALRLQALEQRAVEIVEKNRMAPLPLLRWVGAGPVADYSFPEGDERRLAAPLEEALTANILTKSDIAQAKKV